MLLSKSFLNKFEDNPKWPSLLGQFVYLRTYSRYLPSKKRRETWKETVTRVVEYSMSLDLYTNRDKQIEEAQKLFNAMFNLSVFPAGRTLWTGGTEAAKKYPLSNFNCSFMIVDDFQAFLDAFYLMMLGTGVGFRVLPEDVKQLPKIKSGLAITHKEYDPISKSFRKESSDYLIAEENGKQVMELTIGDSKEGWVSGLEAIFTCFTSSIDEVIIDYNNVRPAGEQLKTFGGRASGHEALRDMYEKIVGVLNEGTHQISTVQAMDIMNLIGEAVVVGGVRRSSEITLFDINDATILDAKVDLWTDPAKANKRFRSMSNNSVFFTQKPTKEQLLGIFDRIVNNGEPGFINAEAAAKRRPWYAGTNPCAEILLADNGVCNLSEINVRNFVKNDEYGGYLNMVELEEAVVQATRLGVRMATLELELPHWNKVQQRDRLTGVSLTGYVEAFDALGVSTTLEDSSAIRAIDRNGLNRHRLKFYTLREVLEIMNHVAQEAALTYADELRIPTPLLVTTVKPSGTIAQLPTVSSGAHASFAPFYVRRVRISSKDPLAQAMLESGYPIYPEATSCMPDVFTAMSDADKKETLKNALTWVVEFPIKTSAKKASATESAVEQLNRYFILQKYWTDHNTSITVTFSPEEVNDVIDLLLSKWEDYIGVSFLPKFTTAYPLMPYEAIDELEYERRFTEVVGVTGSSIIELLEKHENIEVDDDLGTDCEGGACPIR